jgi:putative flippase GtrA
VRPRGTLARSLLVGIAATLADLLVLHLLVRVGGLAATLANVPSLLVGMTFQFFGNKYWAFADGSSRLLRQSVLFAVVEAGTFVLNAAAFHVLVAGFDVPYLAARPAGTLLVYLIFSYPLWARIFRPAAARPRERPVPRIVSSPAARRARGCPPP